MVKNSIKPLVCVKIYTFITYIITAVVLEKNICMYLKIHIYILVNIHRFPSNTFHKESLKFLSQAHYPSSLFIMEIFQPCKTPMFSLNSLVRCDFRKNSFMFHLERSFETNISWN